MSSKSDRVFQHVEADIVSREGALRKPDGECRHEDCLNRGVHSNSL